MKCLKGKKINWIVLALLIYLVVVAISFIVPKEVEKIIFDILETIFIWLMPLLVGWVVYFNGIFTGEWTFLAITIICFTSTALLRWRLPEKACKMLYYLPIIYYMVGLIYLFPFEETNSFERALGYAFVFYLCTIPALVGILIGKVIRHWNDDKL